MEKIIFQENSGEFPVIVTEEDSVRTLHFDGDERQSCIDLNSPHILQLDYTKWMMTALLIPKKLSKIMVCGLGGGAFVHFIHHHHPEATINIVEKDKRVIEAAKNFFALPAGSHIAIHNDDIIDHLCSPAGQTNYDVILVDIFGQGCMAPALYVPEFYRTFRKHLNKKGVMAVNLWSGDKQNFSMAIGAVRNGSDNHCVQMNVKKKSNTIFMAFADQVPKSTLRKIRKKAMDYQKKYELPFHTYLKKLRRTNKLIDFIQGV